MQIILHTQALEAGRFLPCQTDPGAGPAMDWPVVDILIFEINMAGFRGMVLTAHDHQGKAAFTRTIGPEQRMNFPLGDIKIQIMEHRAAIQRQRDVGHLEQRGHESNAEIDIPLAP